MPPTIAANKTAGKKSRKERCLQTTIRRPSARLLRPQCKVSQTHMPRLTQPEQVFGNSRREKQPSPWLVRRHFHPPRKHIRLERGAQDGMSALGHKRIFRSAIARTATDKIRIGHQSENRQGARPQRAAITSRPRRPDNRINHVMSAIGTKRTSACALHMSAFDPKRTYGLILTRAI